MRRVPTLAPRKVPRQRRAQVTTTAILDASARILVKEGFDALTTNRIAELAGVSVGSIYQYFAGKDAILAALAERHFARMGALLEETAAKVWSLDPAEGARAYIRAKFAIHRLDRKLHSVLFEHLPKLYALRMWSDRTVQLVRSYFEHHRTALRPRNLDVAAFVTTHALEAIAEAAALVSPRLLDQDAFIEETADLIVRYMIDAKPAKRRRRT